MALDMERAYRNITDCQNLIETLECQERVIWCLASTDNYIQAKDSTMNNIAKTKLGL